MASPLLPRILSVALCAVLLWNTAPDARAQFDNKWLSAGSFHNWYSEIGSECEECGFVRAMQDGWRWPGIYHFTDMQVAKALWIGATDVTGPEGSTFPVRVVHVGPRVSGGGEFFPVEFETVSKYPLPIVTVDGNQSFSSAEIVVDRVDPDQAADVMIVNAANTLLGITMERRIMQFSQGFHDNYHVLEYVFTNTGNTDRDAEIELPDQTLEGVTFFFQYRLAPTANSRYAIGNPTGWGKNTMNDTRGDGLMQDPPDEQFRAQFAWHGNFPPFTSYDNLGGPLLPPAVPAINVAAGDTLGRLASAQFAGVVTLHADASAGDEMDDAGQPFTTTWIHSDAPFTSNNDPFSTGRMQVEYDVMTSGHKSPRHALAVEPTGLPGFLNPTGDPSQGTTGGFSSANGYGPYTLAPGESVRIVMAEGAAGISREAATVIGQQFKASGADSDALLTYTVGGRGVEHDEERVGVHEPGLAVPDVPPGDRELRVGLRDPAAAGAPGDVRRDEGERPDRARLGEPRRDTGRRAEPQRLRDLPGSQPLRQHVHTPPCGGAGRAQFRRHDGDARIRLLLLPRGRERRN